MNQLKTLRKQRNISQADIANELRSEERRVGKECL